MVKISVGDHVVWARAGKTRVFIITEDEGMKQRLRMMAANEGDKASVLCDEGDGALIALIDREWFMFGVVPGDDDFTVLEG